MYNTLDLYMMDDKIREFKAFMDRQASIAELIRLYAIVSGMSEDEVSQDKELLGKMGIATIEIGGKDSQ